MDKIREHLEICNELNELYQVKNRKYGDSFGKTFLEYGPSMLCIRLEDKLSRAKQLFIYGETGTNDESIIDTLMDLANYSIMGIIELQGDNENE